MHRNYEWKKDSQSRLPGWNFLRFKKTGIRSYITWLTEYKKNPRIKRKTKAPIHKNTVYKLLKIELDLNIKGQFFYGKLFSKPLKQNIFLSCKTKINFKSAKTNSFKKIVLACRDLDKFHKYAKSAVHIKYEGETAAFIKNPSRGWDIIVVER
ncbi:MAG: hypothetical protein KDD58_12185 [Bdellovibrionales bacterium]|nr:hypothetical protein [Bdellovibrionales bacterium]